MTVLSIRMIGDPVLRTPAAEVIEYGPELAWLVHNMTETMHSVNGAGLAAPQVGVGLRVFTYAVDGEEGHVVNPVLTISGGLQGDDQEGCLSVPGIGFALPRADEVQLRGFDVTGRPLQLDAAGMLARCFQHETDHLDGRLYIDRLEGEDRRAALRAIRHARYNDVTAETLTKRSTKVESAFGRGASSTGHKGIGA